LPFNEILFGKLKWISASLGKAPSLLYILLYITIVFAFGGIYQSLPPRSFYHSTSKFEYEFFDPDANAILERLRQEILQVFNEHYQQPVVSLDCWQIDSEEFNVHSLNVKEFPEDFKFKIQIPTTCNLENGNHIWSMLSATVSVPLRNRIVSDGTVYSFIQISEQTPLHIGSVPSPPKSDVLFPFNADFNGGDEGSSPSQTTLPLSLPLYEAIVDFGQGYRGFPTKVSGQYWRMLYLSAGVATSNALGDIAPITTRARLLVTAEAIASLALIGLFLNALGYDIARALKK